ncbi:MAG: hypothetical protein MUC85_00805 [Anaerolineales bacterium]|jgi:hypothetical protein|nr:hypothetical protein [Anaerolineales bacterium]
MRVTRETLLKLAKDFVAERTRSDRTLLGVYLQGALVEDEPLLGGITDLDLFLVHSDAMPQNREIIRISDEIHLDLAHHYRSQYRQPRDMRRHPWLGDCINGGKILYDPQHFLDFTQASVRGQFNRQDQVLLRSRTRLDHAREIWLALHETAPGNCGARVVTDYLRAVENAVNAVAGLSGAPLTERRFLQRFPARALAVRRPGLTAGLLGLLGAPQVTGEQIRVWLPAWQADFRSAAPESVPVRLHQNRLSYYLYGLEASLNSPNPRDALWPLLRTWTTLASGMPEQSAPGEGWLNMMDSLGLQGDGFTERIAALDAYLDTIDELLEDWGKEHGA